MYRQTGADWSQQEEVRLYPSFESGEGRSRDLLRYNIDGHVRIWSTEAIKNSGNPDYKEPKQLAAMSYHSGTVHSVRFSGNGKYLASGGDDKIICIYNLDPNPPTHTTFGSSLPTAVSQGSMLMHKPRIE